MKERISKPYRLLMFTTLIISGCSMCYELIISAVSSYLLGNSMLQYSVTIGLYMSALGIGSYLSRFLNRNLFRSLVKIELAIGVIGACSAISLFLANIYLDSYEIVMYVEIIVIGTLAGAEIPLLTRIIENDEKNLKLTLSSIFSFDYIGGLIGALAFPLLLIPKLGYFATAFLCGLLNIVAAGLIVRTYGDRIENRSFYKALTLFFIVFMLGGIFFAENLSKHIEHSLYRDHVIFDKQTMYQKLVITKHKDDTRLFIDGNCQFSSLDEYRYHEALIHIPMSQVKEKKTVLVLGGGDGLAVRELLKYPLERIDLVDLDRELVELCKENPHILAINQASLKSGNLNIIIQDAYEFLKKTDESYDLIVVDLPDPNSEALNKLYSNVFYGMCKSHLNEGGVLVSQSTSPYYAKKAFWCINRTMESVGLNVRAYHLEVPSFGDWGFNMAKREAFSDTFKIEVESKYLDEKIAESLFQFGKDELAKDVKINRLTNPVLIEYYGSAVETWR